MFQVATISLSADARQANAALGTTPLGEVSRADLFALLERFRQIDAVQNIEAEPHFSINAPAGKFLVRTGQGKLFLYNARDSSAPYAELTTAEIITQLETSSSSRAPFSEHIPSPPASPPRAPHRGIAAAILVTGFALNGYTLYSVFYVEEVNSRPDVTLITDAAELKMRRHDVVGVFATGGKPGDRTIEISPDGRVKFSELGLRTGAAETTDTYRVGRHAGKLCLATTDSGTIDVLNIDALIYYRDTYRRTK
jgi:hypothetical protein